MIWRRLQAMGALYLQNAACLLPARQDLDENMQYVAAQVEEMGGACYLFSASALLPGGAKRLTAEFRDQADARLAEIIERLDSARVGLDLAADTSALERVEGDLKRERVAFLRARRLAYFGSTKDVEVDSRLESLKQSLDTLYRSGK